MDAIEFKSFHYVVAEKKYELLIGKMKWNCLENWNK